MSFTVVCWDIDTANNQQAAVIAGELTRALTRFRPARMLSHAALISTDIPDGIDAVRDAFDAMSTRFPGQFFYVSVDVPDDSPLVEGTFPATADLVSAHAITGSDRNPLARLTLALAPSSSPHAIRRSRGARTRRSKSTRTRARKSSRKPK